MQTLSKLSDQCKKCPHVDNCDNKRMVACAMSDYKQPMVEPRTVNINVPAMQPILRDASLQAQIAEQLKKDFYKVNFNICSFK